MVTLTNHVIVRAGFTLIWSLALWNFRNILLPNTGEDQKKVLYERRVSGTMPYVKSVPGYCITFIKRLLLATFRIKNLNFTLVIRLNWLAKIKLRGPGPPGSILLLGAQLNRGPFRYYCRGPM